MTSLLSLGLTVGAALICAGLQKLFHASDLDGMAMYMGVVSMVAFEAFLETRQ